MPRSAFLVFLLGLFSAAATADQLQRSKKRLFGRWGTMGSHMIVGGTDARQGEFPEMVSLESFGRHFCGGTLITSRHVLTAAHCTFRSPSSQGLTVRAGTNTLEFGGAVRSVSGVSEHPDFGRDDQHDICVLTLSQPFNFGTTIKTAILAAGGREPADSEKLVVTGWGWTIEGGPTLPRALQKATVPYVPNNRCARLYSHHGWSITENMLCAGNESVGGVDTCQGDSGGPIFFGNDRAQVGITSWGVGCARPDAPGVYTRIPKYRGWIRSITGVVV